MWLDIVAAPDLAHARFADPLRTRHCPATPMRASLWPGLQGGVDHSLHTSRIIGSFPSPARSNLPKRLQTLLTESLSPETDRLAVHAVLRRMRIPGKWGTNSGASGAVPKRTTLGTFMISEVPHLSQGNCACRGRPADYHGSRGLWCRHCFCVVSPVMWGGVPEPVGHDSGGSGAGVSLGWTARQE